MKIKENKQMILIFIIGILLGITVISTIYFVCGKNQKPQDLKDRMTKSNSQNLVMSPKEIHDKENEKINFNVENR